MPLLPDPVVALALEAITADPLELALTTTRPTLAADGQGYDSVTEPTAASYQRVPVAPGDWYAPTDRVRQVDVPIPDSVAADDLGVIVGWVMYEPAGGPARAAGWWGKGEGLAAGTTDITAPCRIDG